MVYCVIQTSEAFPFQHEYYGFFYGFWCETMQNLCWQTQRPELPECFSSNLITAKTQCTESCQLTFDLAATSFRRVPFIKHWMNSKNKLKSGCMSRVGSHPWGQSCSLLLSPRLQGPWGDRTLLKSHVRNIKVKSLTVVERHWWTWASAWYCSCSADLKAPQSRHHCHSRRRWP